MPQFLWLHSSIFTRCLGRLFQLVVVNTAIVATASDDANEPKPRKPPNIVLVLADDLGWKDVGFQGSTLCETPTLDGLASEGLVFTNAYAAAGNCAPSRACLLSGMYTPRHGVYAVGSTDRGPRRHMRLQPIPNKSGLAPSVPTLAEALREAGYATGMFGKWHLDGPDGASPEQQGFDEFFDPRRHNPNADRGLSDDPKAMFSLTTAACAFIEKNRKGPFFCYVAHHGIHTPLEARERTLADVQRRRPELSRRQALYASCTRDLDDAVGTLLEKLKELKLEENTLVLFTSDNGGTQQSPQEPLRGNKGCYYEGGIRVPTFVRWPGIVKSGKSDVPVINVDCYPTFLSLAGRQPQSSQQLDGVDLTPLLTGANALSRKAIFWHFPGYLDKPVLRGRDEEFRTRPVSVIRQGDWKLHLFHEEWVLDGGRERVPENRAVELYNLRDDVGERDDLARSAPEKRDELLNELLAWIERTDAPLSKQTHARNAGRSRQPRIQRPAEDAAK